MSLNSLTKGLATRASAFRHEQCVGSNVDVSARRLLEDPDHRAEDLRTTALDADVTHSLTSQHEPPTGLHDRTHSLTGQLDETTLDPKRTDKLARHTQVLPLADYDITLVLPSDLLQARTIGPA